MLRTKLNIKYLDQTVQNLINKPNLLLKVLPYYSDPFREASDFFYVSKLNNEIVDLIRSYSDWDPESTPKEKRPLKISRYYFFENYRIWDDGVLIISDIRVAQWNNGALTYSLKNGKTGKYDEFPFTEESLDQLKQDTKLAFYTRCVNVNNGDKG